jgi:two-component system, chemotaxis family, sensor kinase Cph1
MATFTRSNQELERFASSASHDLLEPLRMITVYAQLLAQRCAGEIESSRDDGIFSSYIVQGATRMRELLADLLTYAEVGTPGEESIDQIDLNLVAQMDLGNLSFSIDESGAVIDIPTLPMLSGHEVDFIQLFQNLLANAIKYRGERPPTIYISTEARDGLNLPSATTGSELLTSITRQSSSPSKGARPKRIGNRHGFGDLSTRSLTLRRSNLG